MTSVRFSMLPTGLSLFSRARWTSLAAYPSHIYPQLIVLYLKSGMVLGGLYQRFADVFNPEVSREVVAKVLRTPGTWRFVVCRNT
jgi:hypothetical protein